MTLLRRLLCTLLLALPLATAAAEPAATPAADPEARKEALRLLQVMDMEQQLSSALTVMMDMQLQEKPELVRYRGVMEDFFAKHMMTNAESIGISDKQWGSRKKRSSIDAAMLKLLMFETARVKRATLAGTYYDLCANYDRIFKSVSNLIAQRSGIDKNILRA